MDQLDDATLIARAQAGDNTAFGVLVRRHQSGVLRVATVVSGSVEGAEDIAQETFIRAHRGLPSFRKDARLEPWLYQIAANTARNQRRSRGRQARLALKVGSMVPATWPTSEPDDRLLVVGALNRLRSDDRLVIALRYFEDLSEADMAIVLKCRRGTVKSRLARAVDRLRSEIEQ